MGRLPRGRARASQAKSLVNKILASFQKPSGLRLMTHVVAGFPDLGTSEALILAMDEAGADFIEVQIPFSDPMADGPVIMRANQRALDQGTRVADCFKLVHRLQGRVSAPLLFMSYANVPFRLGLKTFIQKSKAAGASGLILPDLPFDEPMEDGENESSPETYTRLADAEEICPVYVVSPDISSERLKKIASLGRGFLYTTLKIGITGGQQATDPRGLAFLKTIRKETALPIAAGFGISTPEQARSLEGQAEIAVVGSQLIRIFEAEGLKGVSDFVRKIKK